MHFNLFHLLLFVTALVSSASAAAIPVPTASVNGNQVISGVLEGDVETFKGIPFAQPPTGDLRLKKPVKYTGTYSGLKADDYSDTCLQVNPMSLWTILDTLLGFTKILPGFAKTALFDWAHGSVSMFEDCLYLNVFRPKGTKPTDKLPVMAWIFGGAFLIGSAGTYPGNKLIDESVAMNQPVIFVSINHRVGPLGFLGGAGPADEGNTNLGLHDQREGLKWIQDHIADFGGDPSKVMLFGQSAGAISVGYQMVANGGDNSYKGKPLFSSAAMQSGGVWNNLDVRSASPQREYLHFAKSVGCGGKSNDKETMACLRTARLDNLYKGLDSYGLAELYGIVTQVLGFHPRPDGDLIPANGFDLVRQNKIAQVPFMSGSNEDDGSSFGLLGWNVTFSSQVKEWEGFLFPEASSSSLDELMKQYPQDVTQGAPYRRGFLDVVTPNNKRFGSLFNDLLFKGPSRFMLQKSTQKRWAWQCSAFHNVIPFVGTFHGTDLTSQFFVDLGPFKFFRRHWISFANHHDPNVGTGLPNWGEYTTNGQEMMDVSFSDSSMTKDNTRIEPMKFLADQPGILI